MKKKDCTWFEIIFWTWVAASCFVAIVFCHKCRADEINEINDMRIKELQKANNLILQQKIQLEERIQLLIIKYHQNIGALEEYKIMGEQKEEKK